MTTDLEKQFFDTFGIEPKPCINKSLCINHYDCASCDMSKYPRISDRKLLKLICLNNRHYVTLEDLICPKNIETIKESVLKKFIERNKVFVDEGYSGFCLKTVQALFKE